MFIYHVVNSDAVDAILKEGLKRVSRGEKGNDNAIIKTDAFLDNLRPQTIEMAGLSRNNNIYGYLPVKDRVIDIRDGKVVDKEKIINSGNTLLQLTIDPKRCYISDLEIYDAIKDQFDSKKDTHLTRLASKYWSNVTRLDKHDITIPQRPEVMVTYDIPVHDIRVIY
jgi:hypothetical protein